MPTDKRATTFRLSEVARQMLELLGRHHGLSATAVLEMAIRELARRDLPGAGQAEASAPPPKGQAAGQAGKKRKEK
jgi:hypothetical protein